jgi:hypothetical protein
MRTPSSPQPIDQLSVCVHRRPLVKTPHRLKEKHLTLGFLGGSITADSGFNWPDPVVAWLLATYPEVAITVENAAIGATGSDSGCLRAPAEIIDRACDLTFVEYAVNDYGTPTARRNVTREGLLRKLLAAGHEVVLVYTFSQDMYDDMMAGKSPASVAEFEALAEHYGLGSIWVGLHGLREVRAGIMRWHEWLPDGLHPTHRGSLSYGQAVIEFLQKEFSAGAASIKAANALSLPTPLYPGNWQNTEILPLSQISTQGPWLLKRVHDNSHLEQVLETHAPSARLSLEFQGRGLALLFDFGKKSAEFLYRVDGGEWKKTERERPSWVGDRGWYASFVISDQLPSAKHTFELEVVHGNRPECAGTEIRLSLAGVLK